MSSDNDVEEREVENKGMRDNEARDEEASNDSNTSNNSEADSSQSMAEAEANNDNTIDLVENAARSLIMISLTENDGNGNYNALHNPSVCKSTIMSN